MADPLLQGKFLEKDLNQAVAIAAMCLQEEASMRPLMSDIETALSFLSGASVERPCSSLVDPELHSPRKLMVKQNIMTIVTADKFNSENITIWRT